MDTDSNGVMVNDEREGIVMWERARNIDSGWVGADDDDRLDETMAAEALAEPFDRSRPHILTALGPIEPAALGPVLVGEDLGTLTVSLIDDNREVLLAELEDAYAVGIRSLVVMPVGSSDERATIDWLAGRAPVHLVPLESVGGNTADLTAVDRAGGLSLQIDAGMPNIDALVDIGIVRDLSFHLAGFVPEMIRTIRTLGEHGVKPARVWIGGSLIANPDLAARLLSAGISFSVQTGDDASEAVARAIVDYVKTGYIDQLMLGSGAERTADQQSNGGTSRGDVIDRFPIDLLEAGLSALQVRQLLVENPMRLFTIRGE